MRVEPEPSALSWTLDAEGNSVAWALFYELTDSLLVETQVEVETLRSNPFDFLLPDASIRLPLAHSDAEATILAPYLASNGLAPPPVAAFAQRCAEQADWNPQSFVGVLASSIQREIVYEIRELGGAHAPEKTLAQGRGACRDLSELFVACCRAEGLAARFVSGYQQPDPEHPRHYMHAWAEAYLPGGGWRGFDPTNGLAVADTHVAVAASASAEGAAAISGTFRGTGASSEITTDVSIEV